MKGLKTTLSWLLITALSLVMLEVASAGLVWGLAARDGNDHLKAQIANFHPLFRSTRYQHPEAPHRRRDDKNHFRFDPRAGFAYHPNMPFEEGMLIGPQGFVCNATCDELPRAKPADEYRIFVFGGSSVAGQGAGHGSRTIAAYMEQQLGALAPVPGKRVRVVNAGIGGYYSTQELARLSFEVLSYQPDLVVFFHGNNDYRAWEYAQLNRDLYGPLIRPHLHSYDFELITGFQRMQSLTGSLAHLLNLTNQYFPVLHYTTVLAKHVRLFGLTARAGGKVATLADSSPTAAGPGGPDLSAAILSTETNSLATMIANDRSVAGIARANGFKAVLALQPCLLLPLKPLTPEEQAFLPQAPTNGVPYYSLARSKYQELARANDDTVAFVDMAGLFETVQEHIFTDFVHYTPRGNELIASALVQHIVPMITAGESRSPVH